MWYVKDEFTDKIYFQSNDVRETQNFANYYLFKRCLPWYLRPFYTYRYYLKHHLIYTESIEE